MLSECPAPDLLIHSLICSSWICNWFGNLDVANAVDYSGHSAFASKSLQPYKVNGKEGGQFKTQDNFSFLRVYGAGHEVPYYQPELALQVFIQTMKKGAIAST
jgi:carboxypeptidase C (cathepsin A)